MAWSYNDYTDNAATVAAKKKKEETEANKPGDYVAGAAVNNAQSALNNHVTNKPGDFAYNDYIESDTVTAAKNALDQQIANKPGAYQSQWQQNLDDTLNKILNREKFTYDVNGDALYQQYKDQFVTQGKMAMMDTMGQAAAMTGGFGNSYAQSVGQQAYQGYLQQLNDKVPELYKLALDQYNREGEDLYNQYGLFSDRENQEYGRYRDSVSDWSNERNYLAGRYDTEADRDYGRYSDNRNFAYGQHRDSVADWQTDRDYLAGRYDTEYSKDYNQYRDSVSDWQAALQQAASDYYNEREFGYGQYSDNRNLSYTDYRNAIADQQWKEQFEEQKRANKASEALARMKSSGGGSTKYDPFGGLTAKDFTEAMRDAAADGNMKDAQALVIAAGNSDEAMEIYHNYFGGGTAKGAGAAILDAAKAGASKIRFTR